MSLNGYDNIDDRITNLENLTNRDTKRYVTTISVGNSLEISSEEHNCGLTPIIQAWYNGSQVVINTTIDTYGNITALWNGTLTSNLTIIIIGI